MTVAADILARLAARQQVSDRVMILVAHPDDETIGLGAQLCRFDDALLVHVTDGAPRDGEDARRYGFTDAADYAAARRVELTAALQAGDAARMRTLCLGIPDKEAMGDLAGLARRVAGLLRIERPAALFTHCYEGGHPDHDAAAFAVHAACRLVSAPPAIIEMPLYHREGGALIRGRFPNLSPRRRPGSMLQATGLPSHGSRPSPGRRCCDETKIVLNEKDLRRKQAMVECFATQLWLLREFELSAERLRIAPDYDFTQPPHPGILHYETLGWGISGADWREAAREAMRELGLGPPASCRQAGGTPAVRWC